MEKKTPTSEGASYLRKEVFSSVSEGNPKEHSEAIRQFSSGISGLRNLNAKLQKINTLGKAQPGINILSVLNSILPEEITTHNSDNPKVHAYFSKQWDDIVLVVNNIVSGKEITSSESAMKVLLEKIDSMIDEQKVSDTIWQEKNINNTIRKHEANIRSHRETLCGIQATYKENTNVVSSVFDLGNGISNIYKQSFKNAKNNVHSSHYAFLKEYMFLKQEWVLSPEQEKAFERIKKMFEQALASKFEAQTLGESIGKSTPVQFGEYFIQDLKDGVIRDLIFAGAEWEAKGLYNSTIGFLEFLFKITTDEKVREKVGQSLSKLWDYTKANCTEPTKVWSDVIKKFSNELEKIKGLPPEKQAHMMGDIAGNIMGTILLGKGFSVGKNWLFTSAKFPKGISLVAKTTEFRRIKTWEHLEKYMVDIKWISKESLPNLIQGLKDGTVKLSELPKDLWIRDKAAELLKYGGEIPESVGVLNNTITKAGDLAISWAKKTGDLAKKAIDSKAVNSVKKTAGKFADTVNDSKLGKGVEKASSTVTKETMKQLATLGEMVGNIEHKLQLLKKLGTTLSFPGKVYDKTKGGLEAMGENYARNMTLKTLNHLEETLETLGENIKELWTNIKNDPRAIATLSRTIGSLSQNVKYLLERLVKDPLLANVTEYWAFIAPIQGKLWFLLEITQGLIGDVKNGVLKGTKWTNNVNIGMGKVSENHWINKKIDGALSPKELLNYSGGMAKFIKRVEINGETKELIGFKDYTGKMVIEPKFEMAQDFKNGYAVVTEGGKVNIIDKKWAISRLDIEVGKVKNIRITDDGRATIELKIWDIDSVWVFDMKSEKYVIKPGKNIEREYNIVTNKGIIFIKNTSWWHFITCNGKLLEKSFKNKPEILKNGFALKDKDGWRIITDDGKLVEKSFKNKPEELHWGDFIAEDASGWRIITRDGKLVEKSFKNKPEELHWGDFIAEDTSGWRIITRDGRLIEKSFKNKPEKLWDSFTVKNPSGWRIITRDGRLIEKSFKNKPIDLIWWGFIAEDANGWRLVTRDGKLIKWSFISEPEEMVWGGFSTKDASGWRIITRDGKLVKKSFKNEPEELVWEGFIPGEFVWWGFIAEDVSGWRLVTCDGKLVKWSFIGEPKKITWWGFIAEDVSGWRIITNKGKLVEKSFKNKPEGFWNSFVAEDELWWRFITGDGKLIEKSFKNKPKPLHATSLIFTMEDASGWQIITRDGKLVGKNLKNEPESMRYGLIMEDKDGWRLMTYEGKLFEGNFKYKPVGLWSSWFKVRTDTGVRLITIEWDILPRTFKDIRLSPEGKIQFEKPNGEISEIDQNFLWKIENSSSLQNNDLLLTAAFLNENKDRIKAGGKNIKRDLNRQTTRYIGEDAPKIISVLDKETKLEDFFVGLRVDNREMSTSFKSLKNTFSGIKDIKKLEKKVGKTVDEGIQIYIQNINARREILNSERVAQWKEKLLELSTVEIAYLKKTYKERMEREFMQAIRQEVAIQEGKLSQMSLSLWNEDNLRKIIGKFVSKENMSSKLQAELMGKYGMKKTKNKNGTNGSM